MATAQGVAAFLWTIKPLLLALSFLYWATNPKR